MNRLPPWFKQSIPGEGASRIMHLLSEFSVNTVCKEARCPNTAYCFSNKKITFMILGQTCTRNCRFCAVNKSEGANGSTLLAISTERSRSANLALDRNEPYRISQVAKILSLDFVVITSVTRDDLPDGGAAIFALSVKLIHKVSKNTKVEVLIPDFQGVAASLECVLDAGPDIVAHNIETVRRLHHDLKPLSDYQLSLKVLSKVKELRPEITTKSSIMLGMGEITQEIIDTMEDLKNSNCDILTLGQYLAPSINHYPVKEFIDIKQFQKLKDIGLSMGFKSVISGPLVRSSYGAQEALSVLIQGRLLKSIENKDIL